MCQFTIVLPGPRPAGTGLGVAMIQASVGHVGGHVIGRGRRLPGATRDDRQAREEEASAGPDGEALVHDVPGHDPAILPTRRQAHKESAETTSPPAFVPSDHHTIRSIPSLTKRTLPSAKSTLTPPG